MANRLKIDEQNIFQKDKSNTKKRSIPFEEYFGEMELDEEEKETRIALAKSLEQVFLFLFVMIGVEEALGNPLDKEYYYGMVQRRYENALTSNGINLDEHPNIYKYSQKMCRDIVDATVDENDKVKDPYMISEDRATFIAENEANSVRNSIVLSEAIKAGYTKKKWITIMDKKTRHTHMLVSGEEIGIYDNFHVGDCEMVAPKVFAEGSDEDAKEVVNCRCSLRFLNKKNKPIEEKEKVSDNREIIQNANDTLQAIIALPILLAEFTPKTLKEKLEEEGHEVVPLAKGSTKNIPFEEGGGYKVNYGGNGLFQYHPPAHSHHKGEYYKISNSENGTRRFHIDGTEIVDE